MAELIDLQDHIEDEAAKEFIKDYLTLLTQGYTLSFPTEVQIIKIQEAWTQIIARLNNDFTDSFIVDISKIWLKLVKRVKGNLEDGFAEKMLEHLTGKKSQEHNASTKTNQNPNLVPDKIPSNISTEPVDNEVLSNISSEYYKTDAVIQSDAEDLEIIKKKKATAIAQADSAGYLIQHLAQIQHGLVPPLPISTLQMIIKQKWESILLNETDQVSEPFILELTQRWFNLVNEHGLPTNAESINKFYIIEKANYQPSPKRKKQKRSLLSIFKRSKD